MLFACNAIPALSYGYRGAPRAALGGQGHFSVRSHCSASRWPVAGPSSVLLRIPSLPHMVVCDVPITHSKRKEGTGCLSLFQLSSRVSSLSSVGRSPSPLHTDGTIWQGPGVSLGEAGHPSEPPLGLAATKLWRSKQTQPPRAGGGRVGGEHHSQPATLPGRGLCPCPAFSSPYQGVSCGDHKRPWSLGVGGNLLSNF